MRLVVAGFAVLSCWGCGPEPSPDVTTAAPRIEEQVKPLDLSEQAESLNINGEGSERHYELEISKADCRVRLTSQSFDAAKHNVRVLPDGYIQIDGGETYGVGREAPSIEFVSVSVAFGGKSTIVSSKFWKDCFDAHVPPNVPLDGENVKLEVDEAGAKIKCALGDGAHGFMYVLSVRRDGLMTRKVEGI